MAKIKLILFLSKKLKDGRHPIMIRITHKNKRIYIATGYSALPDELDGMQLNDVYKKNHKPLTGPELDKRNKMIRAKLAEAEDMLYDSQKKGKPFNLDEVISKLKRDDTQMTFDQLTNFVIQENKTGGRIRNAINFQTMLNMIRDYHSKDDEICTTKEQKKKKNERREKVEIRFESINHSFLKGFETWNLKRENSINTLSVYFRAVRTIFNRAIKEGIIERESYPFGRGQYMISSSPTKKRAISREAIRAIENLELPENSSLWHARNYFLFSFKTRGMNFIDLAHLKVRDIVDGRITYIRMKTKRKNAKSFSIKITLDTQRILDFYTPGKKENDHIFPILQSDGTPERTQADEANALKTYNKYLNKLAVKAKLNVHLTSYTVRHSWATIAKRMGQDISIISDGMGHRDMLTTQTYLDSIENDELDKANELITG
jgi:integrase/recombinase XerD